LVRSKFIFLDKVLPGTARLNKKNAGKEEMDNERAIAFLQHDNAGT
jgi:hypothetical protein